MPWKTCACPWSCEESAAWSPGLPSFWAASAQTWLANLYRPHNQTLLVLVSLGLGTFLVAALFAAQSSILAQIEAVTGRDQPREDGAKSVSTAAPDWGATACRQ